MHYNQFKLPSHTYIYVYINESIIHKYREYVYKVISDLFFIFSYLGSRSITTGLVNFLLLIYPPNIIILIPSPITNAFGYHQITLKYTCYTNTLKQIKLHLHFTVLPVWVILQNCVSLKEFCYLG